MNPDYVEEEHSPWRHMTPSEWDRAAAKLRGRDSAAHSQVRVGSSRLSRLLHWVIRRG